MSGVVGKAKILLVEDNEDDFVLVEHFLPADEFAITWCSSARMARDRLLRESFDLVLLDHGLPDSNSLSFLQEIRKNYEDCPVIVLTGRNDHALAVSAKEMGASTFILKDEISEHLLPAVREVLTTKAIESGVHETVDPKKGKRKFADTADRLYRVLQETMNEGCLVVDAGGVITYANRAVSSVTALGADRLPGGKLVDMFTPETAENLGQALNFLIASQSPRAMALEGRIAREYAQQQDDIAAVRISMRSLHADDGEYEGAVVVLTDISELLRAKQMLSEKYQNEKAQHNQLRALIESSRDGIMLVDRDLRLLVVNGHAASLLALPGGTEEWTNRSLLEILARLRRLGQNFARTALAEIRRIQNGDTSPGSGEVDLGANIVCWMNLPVQADTSRLLVLQDVTAERSVQRMREDLIRTTVHDLRNPLTVISESIQNLKDLNLAQDTEDADAYVDIALGGTQKMLLLVNQILDVSRLEDGKMPVNQRALALDGLIHSAVRAQAPLAAVRGVLLEHVKASTEMVAWVDPSTIDRVLQNLLDNAIKFTRRGGKVEIRSGVWSGEVPGRGDVDGESAGDASYFFVAVADHGSGVPLELKDSLFDKFVTLGAHQGTGLGLSFCKLAVEAHGGHIWYENVAGAGATFFFTVPEARR